ncbi:MAG: alcohol dehydrogenase catalytic domain-containing protein [Planctomycetes bacterium]|nr:alcohol dehydrogenase catalytic domain-containing protein [Planctomycetota bacterium]
MKAIIKRNEGPGLEYAEMPEKSPEPGWLKLKVFAASICGTDIHYNRWDGTAISFKNQFNVQLPFILGHECSGEVVEIGQGVSGFKLGDRISLETHIPCGNCFQCQNGMAHNCADMGLYGTNVDGCFADYAMTPASVAFKLPGGVSNEEGALFEPAGVAMRAVEEGRVLPGDTVLVYGCGPIGLMTVQLLRWCGAAKIIAIDIDEFRLNMARKYGVETINGLKEDVVKRVLELASARRGVDVLLELTGSAKVYADMFDMIRLEGRLVTIGHPGDKVSIDVVKSINFRGIEWKGVFGRRIWDTWWKLGAMVEAKKIDILDVVTHRFRFSEYQEAFEQVDKGAGKILFVNE